MRTSLRDRKRFSNDRSLRGAYLFAATLDLKGRGVVRMAKVDFLPTLAHMPKLPPEDSLLEGSTLYQKFRAERDEILKHKWIKSEEAGRDIGFEAALVDWMLHHRDTWRARQAAES